jgi:glycerophosphoryl diester phosphodiesterase
MTEGCRKRKRVDHPGIAACLALSLALCLALAGQAGALDFQGHRGARGLAPENTLPGFAAALARGVDALELDVVLTRDGVPVVSHDRRLHPDLARDPSGAYVAQPCPLVSALTLEELRRFDVGRLRPGSRYAAGFPHQRPADGAVPPTLAEVIALVRRSGNERVRLNVETKTSPLRPEETPGPEAMVDAILGVLRTERFLDRVIVQSFDWRTLLVVQRVAPGIPTAYLTQTRGNWATLPGGAGSAWTAGIDPRDFPSLPAAIKAAGGAIWSPHHAEIVAEAHRLGLRVIVWTVNEPIDMVRMIELGVDGIITDYPDRLGEVARARGMPVPTPTPVVP